MNNSAIILFAHGARDPEWATPIRRVQAAIARRAPQQRVELAFLELMAPTLAECAAALLAAGMQEIVIVPMFIAQGGHLKRDVPELVAQLRAAHPAVSFRLAPPVGEAEAMVQAMANYALGVLTEV